MRRAFLIGLLAQSAWSADGVIEKQLKSIGEVPNEEVVVVQKAFTSKDWRHEFSPFAFGGVPFGTVRRTLIGGASYTLHVNTWLAWEAFNFLYTKTIFTSFADDVNANQPSSAKIAPDYQKLVYFATTGFQITPTYGKVSTFSRWIAYLEPYLILSMGLAKTETVNYLAFVPGIGARFFFREWVSMRIELRDYLFTEKFTDNATGAEGSALRNNYSVLLSLSFWLPKMPR